MELSSLPIKGKSDRNNDFLPFKHVYIHLFTQQMFAESILRARHNSSLFIYVSEHTWQKPVLFWS